MKRHHPNVFAILKAQPMGFYAPAQLVRNARAHGVEIRPVDVNHSRWDCTRNRYRYAVRLGLRLVRSLANADGSMIPIARGDTPYTLIEDLWRQAGIPVSAL
jgi:error-prone DNA polymerase